MQHHQLPQQQQHQQSQQLLPLPLTLPPTHAPHLLPHPSLSSLPSLPAIPAIISDPTDWKAQNEAGMVMHRNGLLEQSVEHLSLAAQHSPLDNSIARKNLAMVKVDIGTRYKLAGNIDTAIQSYLEAISIHPPFAPAYFNLAVIYSERGQYDAALKYYQLAIQHNANYVEALTNIGVIYKNSAQLSMAIEYYERALKVNPNFHIASSNLAIALTDWATQIKNEGRLDEAITYYKKALHHNSKYPASWYNLGVAYAERGRFDDAKVCYEMAVLFDAKCAEAYNNLGVIYKDRGNLDQAIHYYHEALAANPSFSQTLNNISVIYTMLGKLDEAYSFCSRAIKTNPHYGEAWNNMGVLFRDEGRIEEALHSYAECLRIDPLSRNAAQNKLLALNSLTKIEPLQRIPDTFSSTPSLASLTTTSSNAAAPSTVSTVQFSTHHHGDPALSRSLLSSSSSQQSFPLSSVSNLSIHSTGNPNSYLTPSDPAIDQRLMDAIFEAHASWGTSFSFLYERDRYSEWPDCKKVKDRVLRIGYISADFFIHSVSYFIEAPLLYRDQTKTHVTCYSNVARRDKKTFYFERLCDSWRNIFDKSTKETCEMIRRDRIDILIELTGHTAGNRLDVMAMKPAPIQITWIGYPNTTGLGTIDYRLTDEIVDPINTTQRYTETLLHLPGPFLCYTPPADAPNVTDTPALKNGYITFGSFNNLAKVNDRVLSVWCAILAAVPYSRMLMKCKPFASPTVIAKMHAKFAAFGIAASRVDLISLLPTTTEHLDAYSAVDISVDTFPYAGTTTTCEALWMGIPVITYEKTAPPIHSHNVGATLISRMTLPEPPSASTSVSSSSSSSSSGISGSGRSSGSMFIAKSEREYVEMAVALAADIPRLQWLRQYMRESMKTSACCDGPNFVAGLENVYRNIWNNYCNHK